VLSIFLAAKEDYEGGYLFTVRALVAADAFADLLEQARELSNKNFHLAAGVLGRAVLEEHLRNLCGKHSCLPPGRPTIGELNSALYAGGHLDKVMMHGVTAMAAVGNHCAHNNQPPRSADDIKRFLDDISHFLMRTPL
jgi:hypothetical protein